MVTSIKTELKTWFLTGRAILLLVFVLITYIGFSLSSLFSSIIVFGEFSYTEYRISDDKMMEEKLQEPLFDSNGDINTLLQNKLMMEEILFTLSSDNAFVMCEEVGLYLLPLILSIIGALTVCKDQSSNVMRIRVSREGKWRYLLAKQLAMILISVGLIFLAILLYKGISKSIFDHAASFVTSKYIDTSGTGSFDFNNGPLRIAFFILFIILFLEIGFCLGYISKTPIVPIVIVGFFWYFNLLPTFYEPRNALYNLAMRLFVFVGTIPNGITSEISLFSAFLIALLMLFIPFGGMLYFWNKRSAYK